MLIHVILTHLIYIRLQQQIFYCNFVPDICSEILYRNLYPKRCRIFVQENYAEYLYRKTVPDICSGKLICIKEEKYYLKHDNICKVSAYNTKI